MRHGHWYVAVLSLAIVGCTEAYSPDPQVKIITSPTVEVPRCRGQPIGDPREFASVVSILRRNGDTERAAAFYLGMRRAVEQHLAETRPDAPSRLKPALDAFFSGAEIESQAMCQFARNGQAPGMVEDWERWSSDAVMRQVHGRLMGIIADPSRGVLAADPARRALLERVLVATDYQSLISTLMSAQRQAMAVTETAVDPTSSMLQDIARNERFVRPPGETELIDAWLGPSLAGVTDADLERFLAFAESNPGKTYYRTLRETYVYTMTDWYERLGALLSADAASPVPAQDPAMAAGKVAEARRLLDVVGTRVVMPEARTLLLQAERLDPDNAEIQTLLGRIAKTFASNKTMYAPDRLRPTADAAHSQDPVLFAEAESRLAKAIELDSRNAEAQLYMGHLRFLQSRDEEAVRHFLLARTLDPLEPSLPLFEAGLAYEQGRLRDAERLLRQVLAKPEGRAYNHFHALKQLRLVLDTQGRGREYDAVVASQLKRDPRMWDVRIGQAERMIRNGARSSDVLAMIEPVPDTWLPDAKRALMFDIRVREVVEAPAASRDEAARRVFEIAEQPMHALDSACRTGGRELIAGAMVRASGAQQAFADGLMACAMWNRDTTLAEAVLPFIRDIDRPNPGLQGNSPLCNAVSQMNGVLIEWLLTKAKADPAKPCVGSKTPRDLVRERAESTAFSEEFRASARATLKLFDPSARGR